MVELNFVFNIATVINRMDKYLKKASGNFQQNFRSEKETYISNPKLPLTISLEVSRLHQLTQTEPTLSTAHLLDEVTRPTSVSINSMHSPCPHTHPQKYKQPPNPTNALAVSAPPPKHEV